LIRRWTYTREEERERDDDDDVDDDGGGDGNLSGAVGILYTTGVVMTVNVQRAQC